MYYAVQRMRPIWVTSDSEWPFRFIRLHSASTKCSFALWLSLCDGFFMVRHHIFIYFVKSALPFAFRQYFTFARCGRRRTVVFPRDLSHLHAKHTRAKQASHFLRAKAEKKVKTISRLEILCGNRLPFDPMMKPNKCDDAYSSKSKRYTTVHTPQTSRWILVLPGYNQFRHLCHLFCVYLCAHAYKWNGAMVRRLCVGSWINLLAVLLAWRYI